MLFAMLARSFRPRVVLVGTVVVLFGVVAGVATVVLAVPGVTKRSEYCF